MRHHFLIAALFLTLISSCIHKEEKFAYVDLSAATPTATIKPTPANPDDLEMIRKFAESYEPKSGRVVIPEVPELNEKLLKVLFDLAASGSREHEKYIILIFLRLSRFHNEHFHQSYELGRENPLTIEFYRLIGETNYKKAEYMGSGLADGYVKTHQELLDYPLIKTEWNRIDNAKDKIQRFLDETTKKQATP